MPWRKCAAEEAPQYCFVTVTTVPWELPTPTSRPLPLPTESIECEICHEETCGADEELGNQIVLCSHCNRGFHQCCLDPSLSAVPEGAWLCSACQPTSPQQEQQEDREQLQEEERRSILAQFHATRQTRGSLRVQRTRSKALKQLKKEEEARRRAEEALRAQIVMTTVQQGIWHLEREISKLGVALQEAIEARVQSVNPGLIQEAQW